MQTIRRHRELVELRPATERLAAWLPGGRWVRLALWASIPWLNAAANVALDTETSAVWEGSSGQIVLNYAALSAAVAIALVGADHLARRVRTFDVAGIVEDAAERRAFRELGSSFTAVVGAVVLGIAFGVAGYAYNGWDAAILRGLTWLVLGFAFCTFVWTYGIVQVGLARVGREQLRLAEPAVDPHLGLRPLGELASTSLWLLLAWLLPVVLTATSDLVGVAIGAAVLAAGIGAFFLSLLRLHRQMLTVKDEQLAVARNLYADAYAPVRREPTLESLQRQQSLLGAADALEQRADRIHEWPLGEGTVARLATIVTSVLAVIVARMILNPFGL